MKKVRYAVGAVGLLPAAGLLAPTATAASTQPSATTGKSVRLLHRVTVAAPCNARNAHSSSHFIRGYISYSRDNGCIGFVEGHFYHSADSQTELRVRFYAGGVQVGPTRYVHGTIHRSHTSVTYKSSPFVKSIQQACEAIVFSSTHGQITGAVCEPTGF